MIIECFVALTLSLNLCESSVLCRNCGRELADPFYLRTKHLSPEFIERRNKTQLFGATHPVSIERLKNPAGVEFEVVSFQKAGKLNLLVHFLPFSLNCYYKQVLKPFGQRGA